MAPFGLSTYASRGPLPGLPQPPLEEAMELGYEPMMGQQTFPSGPSMPMGNTMGRALGNTSTGKKGRHSNWWMLAAAPIIAGLVSKFSGGEERGGISFSDALAHLGTGFGAEKFRQISQERQRKFDEEGKFIQLAHKIVLEDLGKLGPAAISKYPSLQQLSQKYQDALADGKGISAKEASDIVGQYNIAKHDLENAQREQGIQRDDEDIMHKADSALRGQEMAQKGQIERGVISQGGWGPLGNEGIDRLVNEKWENTYGTVPVTLKGQTYEIARKEAPQWLRVQNQEERINRLDEIAKERLKVMQGNLSLGQGRFNWEQGQANVNRIHAMARSIINANGGDIDAQEAWDQAESLIEQGANDPAQMTRPPVGPSSGASPVAGGAGSKYAPGSVRVIKQ